MRTSDPRRQAWLVPSLLVVPLLGGVLLAARRDSRRVVPRSLAAALLVVAAGAGLAQWGMQRGQRAELPLLNVLFFRIAPEPAALDWWRARGLPWGPELEPFERTGWEKDSPEGAACQRLAAAWMPGSGPGMTKRR